MKQNIQQALLLVIVILIIAWILDINSLFYGVVGAGATLLVMDPPKWTGGAPGTNTPLFAVSKGSKHENVHGGIDKTIYFYHREDPYYEFTNFWVSPMQIDGEMYKTAEHYFQSQKFSHNPFTSDEVRNASGPGDAFKLARKYSNAIRSDWHKGAKEDVMLKVLRKKFTQNEQLKYLLLSTCDKKLVEDSPDDDYWGIGKDGDGDNVLGELLMQVRKEIRRDIDMQQSAYASASASAYASASASASADGASKILNNPCRVCGLKERVEDWATGDYSATCSDPFCQSEWDAGKGNCLVCGEYPRYQGSQTCRRTCQRKLESS